MCNGVAEKSFCLTAVQVNVAPRFNMKPIQFHEMNGPGTWVLNGYEAQGDFLKYNNSWIDNH